MKKIDKIFIVASLFVIGVAYKSNAQSCQNYRFALTCISNTTNITLNYSIKWGCENWVNYSVAPGDYMMHYIGLRNGTRNAPILQIQFDKDLSDYTYMARYTLEKYAASAVSFNQGWQYSFRYANDGNIVDIYNDSSY